MDAMLLEHIATDEPALIFNLAGGLDARPWRLPPPPALRWINVEQQEVLEHKRRVVGSREAACHYDTLEAHPGTTAGCGACLALARGAPLSGWARLALWLSTSAVREEFGRLSGVVLLVRTALAGCKRCN